MTILGGGCMSRNNSGMGGQVSRSALDQPAAKCRPPSSDYALASSKIVRAEALSTASILRLSSRETTCCSSTASWERR